MLGLVLGRKARLSLTHIAPDCGSFKRVHITSQSPVIIKLMCGRRQQTAIEEIPWVCAE